MQFIVIPYINENIFQKLIKRMLERPGAGRSINFDSPCGKGRIFIFAAFDDLLYIKQQQLFEVLSINANKYNLSFLFD